MKSLIEIINEGAYGSQLPKKIGSSIQFMFTYKLLEWTGLIESDSYYQLVRKSWNTPEQKKGRSLIEPIFDYFVSEFHNWSNDFVYVKLPKCDKLSYQKRELGEVISEIKTKFDKELQELVSMYKK